MSITADLYGVRADSPAKTFASALEVVRRTPFSHRPGDPTPAGYYGALFDDAAGATRSETERKRLAYYKDVLRVARMDPRGLDVLEAGSGFGIGLISVACLGAASATGIELVDWQAEWSRACVARLAPELAERIRVHTGTVCDLPVDDESMDVVLSLEAISHYLDYKPFLGEAWRVLRPGGKLIVSDGNNGRNRKIWRHTEQMWADHEADPRLTMARDDPIVDHDPWQLVEHRRRIILEAAPELSDELTWELALNTSGMIRGEITESVLRYLATGVKPDRPYKRGTLIVHPDQEMVIERLFDPNELGREIAAHGFSVKVRGHWAGASSRSHQLANDLLAVASRVTMPTARGFRIVASKQSRRQAPSGVEGG